MNSEVRRGSWQESIGNQAPPRAANGANRVDVPAEASALTSPVAGFGVEWRKKAVLLVDSNRQSREERAAVMRKLGLHVDCAISASAARVRLAAQKYNLVLVDLGRDIEGAESFVAEVRARGARQLVQFLVGSPLFLASSLNGSSARPSRPSALAIAGSGEKTGTPAVTAASFGPRIRDVEAEQAADEAGTH